MTLAAFAEALQQLDPTSELYAKQFVATMIQHGLLLGASDIHLQPREDQVDVRARLDGVLHPVGQFRPGQVTDIVARLKVLAQLPTYLKDIPQEGRIEAPGLAAPIRLSIFPTVHGERAALRIFGADQRHRLLGDLGLPSQAEQALRESLSETSGLILITGPAGSGKTTTLYACLREITGASAQGRHVATLEDPVEAILSNVSQTRVRADSPFDLASAARALIRQDPDVIAIGEIRDAATASVVLQAAQTGHLVLATFHAGSAPEAVGRFLDMQLEVYLLRNALRVVLSQRLLRVLCECKRRVQGSPTQEETEAEWSFAPAGCPDCRGTGYRGRRLVAEVLPLWNPALRSSIVQSADNDAIKAAAGAAGMVSCQRQAWNLVRQGFTSLEEFHRLFGFSHGNAQPVE